MIGSILGWIDSSWVNGREMVLLTSIAVPPCDSMVRRPLLARGAMVRTVGGGVLDLREN